MASNTARHHGPSRNQHRRFRKVATILQAIRRRPLRVATFVSLIGPPLVSLLLDLLGRNGDLLIAVAVSFFLLTLIRMLTVMKREAPRPSTLDPDHMPREPRVERSGRKSHRLYR